MAQQIASEIKDEFKQSIRIYALAEWKSKRQANLYAINVDAFPENCLTIWLK